MITVRFQLEYSGAYGCGEKFNAINLKGQTVVNTVEERFCHQGEKTYLSVPFFFTDSGFGIFVDTKNRTVFRFLENEISMDIPADAPIRLYYGTPKEIVGAFHKSFGTLEMPPAKAFGIWISANHWQSEADVDTVLAALDRYDFPATVLVLEAWSDENTFYIWNGAKYTPKPDGKAFSYEDFDFSESPWPDPKGMIARLAKRGILTVLWQIPVYKQGDTDETQNHPMDLANTQRTLDEADAISRQLCVRTKDGFPYRIPTGNWFAGSLIPDFTNEKTKETWFAKRRYLTEIGIGGFKTDGGEFIYREDTVFSDGSTGAQMKNGYCQSYINAYTEALRPGQLLFSRAGTNGAQVTPFLWAGDHESDFEELLNVYRAALSAACSGILFTGFDIGGFAGALPSANLYLRSTQLACFMPIMQWHSEPDGGQFQELLPSGEGNNERSPWNIAQVSGDPGLLDELRFWHHLRMALQPYILREAKKCVASGIPLSRPLFFEEPGERMAWKTEDEYFFGEALLIAPLLYEGEDMRKVWLPKGRWTGLFSGQTYTGGAAISSTPERYPVYVRETYEKELRDIVKSVKV